MDKEQLQELIAATGALAEMTVLFYKSALNTGATVQEAQMLTQLFLGSFFKNKDA